VQDAKAGSQGPGNDFQTDPDCKERDPIRRGERVPKNLPVKKGSRRQRMTRRDENHKNDGVADAKKKCPVTLAGGGKQTCGPGNQLVAQWGSVVQPMAEGS